MPWASAFIGRASAFIVHNFITDKWIAMSSNSHMKIYVSVPGISMLVSPIESTVHIHDTADISCKIVTHKVGTDNTG